MDNTRVTLGFSGGLDSTFLLHLCSYKYSDVDSFAGVNAVNPVQAEKERKARDAIIKEITDIKHETASPLYRHIHFDVSVHGTQLESNGLGQVSSWLYLASGHIRHDTSKVLIGYVKGDEALTNAYHIKEAWRHMLLGSLFNRTRGQSNIPELIFPLELTSKVEILRTMPWKILQHVTWCESFTHTGDCGTCDSCKRMLSEVASFQILYPEYWKTHILRERHSAMKRLYNKELRLVQSK